MEIEKEVLITALLIIATSSTSLFVILTNNAYLLLCLALMLIIIGLLVVQVKAVFMLKFILFFQGFFTIASIITQFIVNGSIMLESLILSNTKILVFIVLSFIFAKSVSSTGLVKLFEKISVNLGVSIALAVKFIRFFPITWAQAYRIYSINYDSISRLRKIKVIMMSTKAFVNLSLYSALQTAESLATRNTIIFSNKKLKR